MSRATSEVYQDKSDDWRWRLVHDNGTVIADSGEGYVSRQTCGQGIDSATHNAEDAPVESVDD